MGPGTSGEGLTYTLRYQRGKCGGDGILLDKLERRH
jgi:hypothetical protein